MPLARTYVQPTLLRYGNMLDGNSMLNQRYIIADARASASTLYIPGSTKLYKKIIFQ